MLLNSYKHINEWDHNFNKTYITFVHKSSKELSLVLFPRSSGNQCYYICSNYANFNLPPPPQKTTTMNSLMFLFYKGKLLFIDPKSNKWNDIWINKIWSKKLPFLAFCKRIFIRHKNMFIPKSSNNYNKLISLIVRSFWQYTSRQSIGIHAINLRANTPRKSYIRKNIYTGFHLQRIKGAKGNCLLNLTF